MKMIIRSKARKALTIMTAASLMISAAPVVGGNVHAATNTTPQSSNTSQFAYGQSYYGLLGNPQLSDILVGTNWMDEENMYEDGMLEDETFDDDEFGEEMIDEDMSEESSEDEELFEEEIEEEEIDENYDDSEDFVEDEDIEEVEVSDSEDEFEDTFVEDIVDEEDDEDITGSDRNDFENNWDEFEEGDTAGSPEIDNPTPNEEQTPNEEPAPNEEVPAEEPTEDQQEPSSNKVEISDNDITNAFNTVFGIDNSVDDHSETIINNHQEVNNKTEVNQHYNYNTNNFLGRCLPRYYDGYYRDGYHRARPWRYNRNVIEEKKSELVVVIVNQIEKEKEEGSEYINFEGNLYKLEKDEKTGEVKAVLLKAKDSLNVVIPSSIVTSDKKVYEVSGIAEDAFNNSKALRVVIETGGLEGDSVVNSLRASKLLITKISVTDSGAELSYTDYYKTIFSKENSGKWTIIV